MDWSCPIACKGAPLDRKLNNRRTEHCELDFGRGGVGERRTFDHCVSIEARACDTGHYHADKSYQRRHRQLKWTPSR